MAASESGGEAARPWTASSTWAPAGGAAVEDAVSFDTSDEDAESPAGVVLTRPDPDEAGDAPPCEVTVRFRGMYEIHRIYVRSTARIYEIYHSTDTKGTNKDYLCTVRCGLATKEPQPSGEESNASTSEKRGHETKSISSSSSDDSWVDVKIPESPKTNNTSESQERNIAGTCQDNNMAHYEATAEMTDVSPCVSLTVRLLSLQSKTSVHIEEIYIYADPVESTNDDSALGAGNMGGSSLLAMLVPGLMQMSKSRTYKIDDGYFSHGSRSQPAQDHAVKGSSTDEEIAQEAVPYRTDDPKYKPAWIERGIYSSDGGTISNEKSNQNQLQHKDRLSVQSPVQTTENTREPPVKDQLVADTTHLANPLINGIVNPYNHIERKLDTLLSKVEKMELYCSRFEESMIKPLGNIEGRLQRLEQQFDSFSVEIQSLRDLSSKTPASITERKPGLFVRAPDFSSENSCSYNVTDGNLFNFCGPNMVPSLDVKVPEFTSQCELTNEKLHEGPISPFDSAQSSEQKERKTSPGLVVKVPEFEDDDDEEEVEDEVKTEAAEHDDQTRDDTLCSNTIDSSKSKNRVSVNGALASALEALLMSTKGTSSSKSVVFPASSVSAENTNESSSCSLCPRKADEMSTKDGSVDHIPDSICNANMDGTFKSCQEIDEAPRTSLPEPVSEGIVDTNEKNNYLDSDKLAFVASTVSLDVPSQHSIVQDAVDMMVVTSTGPLDSPQPPAACESVDIGAQANENRHIVSLAEFLATRNSRSFKKGTSEVGCSNGDGMLSFERTLAGAGKNSNISAEMLVKKALEFDGEDESVSSVPVGATFEGSSYVVKWHNMNRIESLSDKDFGLENTESSARVSVGLNSVYSQCSATGSQKNLTENSSFDCSLQDSFPKPNAEEFRSALSSIESSSGPRARQPVVSASTAADKYVEDLLAGIGVSSAVTPIACEELQKVCDLLYEYKDDMLGTTSIEKITSKSSPSLEVLLAESSDSESQISDMEDIDNDAGIGSARIFGSFSSDDSASARSKPLVDVVDLPTESEAYAPAMKEPLVDVTDLPTHSETASGLNKPFFDVVDLPTSSEAVPDLSEPLVDVVDQPATSETAPVVNEPLANLDDLPKPLDTLAVGSSGEHPNSLI